MLCYVARGTTGDVFRPEQNHLEHFDCLQNLMRWHKGFFYSKWPGQHLPKLSCAQKKHRLIQVCVTL